MNRREILDRVSITTHVKNVDGIGEVNLKEMSGGNRDEYFSLLAKADKIKFMDEGKEVEVPDVKGVKPFVISRLLVDDNDKVMFSEEEVATQFTPETMDALFDAISEINGIDEDAVDKSEKN